MHFSAPWSRSSATSSPRPPPGQQIRIGAAGVAAHLRAYHRILSGDEIRDDGFFSDRPDGSGSPAEETIESVLQAIQNETEQRKARYLGYMLANITFEDQIDPRTALDLVAEAEALSYTQLCLLSAWANARPTRYRIGRTRTPR